MVCVAGCAVAAAVEAVEAAAAGVGVIGTSRLTPAWAPSVGAVTWSRACDRARCVCLPGRSQPSASLPPEHHMAALPYYLLRLIYPAAVSGGTPQTPPMRGSRQSRRDCALESWVESWEASWVGCTVVRRCCTLPTPLEALGTPGKPSATTCRP